MPVAKYLFGSTAKSKTMDEVMIFITPTVLPMRNVYDPTPRKLKASPGTLDE